MLRVVCLKWGDKYPAAYVNRLMKAVGQNLSIPHSFHCLTEDHRGLDPDVQVIPLPDLDLEGWWFKLLLFKRGFLPFSDEDWVLYLDLDLVILSQLDNLVDMGMRRGTLLSASADDRPDRLNSSVLLFRNESLGFVWESFSAQRAWVLENLHGDQDWIERVVPSAHIFAKNQVCSFKIDLPSKTPFSFGLLGRWFRRRFPRLLRPRGEVPKPDCAIVLFHGKPDPHDVMDGSWDKYRAAPWIKDYWQ